jgi:hypothetical protein
MSEPSDMEKVAWSCVNYAHSAALQAKADGRHNAQRLHEANEARARALIAELVAATSPVACVICANGNDLPDGEECPTCARIGNHYGTAPEPPTPPEELSPLQKALRKAGYRPVVPKQGYA